MIKNYFKIAWRNLLKNKAFSLINIIGLASGLACFILITLYVVDELSFDRYNEKADHIYRVHADIRFGGTDLKLAVSSDPMGATLKKDYPQVEQFSRLYNSDGSKLIKKGNEFIRENNVVHADSTFFDVFTLPAVAGDTRTALNEPNTVVISESTAKKYFGTREAVGKTIETNDNGSTLYKVMAVIRDVPRNSHFRADFFFSMDNVQYGWGNYLSNNHFTYIVLKKGTDYRKFEKNFDQVLEKYVLPQAKQFVQINSMEEFKKAGNRLDYSLMPLTNIHLHSDRFPELGVNGDIQYVYIFSAVALFVLLLACINFMNLSTARSSTRAKEVGIRKVMGSAKKALINQFITESILTSLIAIVFAIGLAWFCLSWFNNLSGKDLVISDLLKPGYVIFLVVLPLITGILAGAYPAFFLSSFNPITVLKGRFNAGYKKSFLRNALVIFQFTTSIVLIVGTIVVYRQLNYIQHKKLGFNKEQLLIINGTGALGNNVQAFKNEVLGITGVKAATLSGYLPVHPSARSDNSFFKDAVADINSGFNSQIWDVDYDYIPVMGMEIITGRNFSKEFGSDSTAVIINEATAAILGYDDPVGEKLYTSDGNEATQDVTYTVIGVVKNFHYESLRQTVGALVFRLGNSTWASAFKVDPANIRQLVKQVESKWKAMAPGLPFSYRFMDEDFNNMYRAEQRVGKIGLSFAIIAILIACLGLFGLAAYMAEQRTKEIGVRKVLGADVADLVGMLSKDFIKLVLFSAVFAFPLAWWAMNTWLQDFAFRININWWVFALAGAVALVIAMATISFQAFKAAVANPVRSLRTE